MQRSEVVAKCDDLRRFWAPRDQKMKSWYKMVEMVDELATANMESFVGNEPRAMYNLTLHLLSGKIPHRVEDYRGEDIEAAVAVGEVNSFLETAWKDVKDSFRQTNPQQSYDRTYIGYMLASGWYSKFAIVSDDGKRCYAEIWNPIQVYPMWDMDMGLSEVAHIFDIAPQRALRLARKNGWALQGSQNTKQWIAAHGRSITVRDYWWVEIADTFPFIPVIWNAVALDGDVVKYEPTRFKRIPVYVAPVGGLPDTGALSEGALLSTTSYNAGAQSAGERWKEEIGQALIATNENIQRTWNKWWTYGLQLLRDTAQPRIFERSRSGKAIVRPEDVFRRGAIFRGGIDDKVDFMATPPIPLELRSTQLDLEAMMQRGGPNWALYGSVTGQMTSYVMSQIAASAEQFMRPFHEAIINLNEDIDNHAWLEDIRDRGVRPYGWKYPSNLPPNVKVSARYEVEIPGDLVHRATVARMLDPEFSLSYSYVMGKLFPEVKDLMREKARTLADKAERHPVNAIIAQIHFYRQQSAYLRDKVKDIESAKLYDMAADVALAQLGVTKEPEQQLPAGRGTRQVGTTGQTLPRGEPVPQLPPGL